MKRDDQDRLLSVKAVCEIRDCSRITLWRHVKEGMFPKPLRIGKRNIKFLKSDVDRWLASRQVVDG